MEWRQPDDEASLFFASLRRHMRRSGGDGPALKVPGTIAAIFRLTGHTQRLALPFRWTSSQHWCFVYLSSYNSGFGG